MLQTARRLSLAAALLFSASVLAENTPFTRLIGFSDNGRYMAWQTAQIQDGSGFFQSTVRIMDTAQDKYVFTKNEEDQNENWNKKFAEFADGAISDAKIGAQLASYSVIRGKGQTVNVSTGPRLSSFTYKGKFVSLYLTEKPVSASASRVAECAAYDGAVPAPGKLLGYRLSGFNVDSHADVLLHDDASVPTTRGCPTGYRISSLFAHGKSLVFLIGSETFGFEGPDVSIITVPASLNSL